MSPSQSIWALKSLLILEHAKGEIGRTQQISLLGQRMLISPVNKLKVTSEFGLYSDVNKSPFLYIVFMFDQGSL